MLDFSVYYYKGAAYRFDLVRPEQNEQVVKLLREFDPDLNELTPAEITILLNQYSTNNTYWLGLTDLATDTLVGVATLFVKRSFTQRRDKELFGLYADIEQVVVAEEARGQGVGRFMIGLVTDFAAHIGCRKVMLFCNDKNVTFYEKCGFEKMYNTMRMGLNAQG